MRLLPSLALAGALVASTCGARSLAAQQADKVAGIDPDVYSVVTGGYWRSGEDEGSYRIVIVRRGWEHVHGELHLQWLRDDQEKFATTVARSIPVREVNDGDVWSLGAGTFILSEDRPTVLVLPATHTYTLAKGSFRITLGPPGEYRVESQPTARRVLSL
jgi:hypothetical protein